MRCNGNLHQSFFTISYIILVAQGLLAATTRMPMNVLSSRSSKSPKKWETYFGSNSRSKPSQHQPSALFSTGPLGPQGPLQVKLTPNPPPLVQSVPQANLNSPYFPEPAPSPAPTLTPTPQVTSMPILIPTKTSNNNLNGCAQIRVRKEWRNMTPDLQAFYISAIKCLMSKPSQLQPGSEFRLYDDFIYVHDILRNQIHWTASFLPWHRNFIYLQEKALIECGYTGSLPRWDWTLDANDFTKSPVWSPDPNVGFGGDGVNNDPQRESNDGIVSDGAFAQIPLLYPTQHFLERGFNSPTKYNFRGTLYGSQYYDDVAIRTVQSSENFSNFRVALEGTNPTSSGMDLPGPHNVIHQVIGGDMEPSSFAPNDPIFYLHHANVDYNWAKWQDYGLETTGTNNRLVDYSGNRVAGSSSNDAQLADILAFMGLGGSQDLEVQKVMDTRAFPYCYECELLALLIKNGIQTL